MGFDTDDGLGLGAHGEIATYEEGVQPYRSLWVVQGYASLRGYQDHLLEWDRVGVGPGASTRLQAGLYWRQWTHSGYWGMGNDTLREWQYEGLFEPDDPAATRYRYSLVQPTLHALARSRIHDGPWSLYGAVTVHHTRVETYEGSLLEEDRPYGMLGGWSPQVGVGVLYDSRQPEIASKRGVLAELSGRLAPAVDGEAGGFAGGLCLLQGYQPLGGRLVLAARLLGEWLAGNVPFYEMNTWGLSKPIIGFGGDMSLRGVPMGRWRGPGKALANVELRWTPWALALREHQVDLELAPFTDVGAVFGQQAATAAPTAPTTAHPSVGLGGRVVFDDTFVGRLDIGWAPDPITQPDGGVSKPWGMGVYVVFGHPF